MEDQIKTNIGKIFTKYNKDADSFDMIRIVHTDNDNLDNVDYSDLEKLSEVIYKFICNKIIIY